MVRVGVISDTHGRLDPRAYNALADCGHIIHAGDIGDPGILRELQTIAPVTAVLGNNDFDEYGSSVMRWARVTIEGVKFLVAHYPRDVVYPSGRAFGPGSPIPDVCVHGHTHMPRLEYGKVARPAQFVLNPGSASRPRGSSKASIARVYVERSAVRAICIESLEGDAVASVGKIDGSGSL